MTAESSSIQTRNMNLSLGFLEGIFAGFFCLDLLYLVRAWVVFNSVLENGTSSTLFFFALHLLFYPQRNTQINRLCYPRLIKSSDIGTGGIAKSSTGRPQTAADCEQSLLRVSFKPTYARTRTHSDKGYCDLALTAGGEVINGSAYSGVVCVGMQRGKS